MTLPVINAPTFFLELPSTKQQVKFRPFLIKEEKILMIALQENNEDVVYEAVKQIVKNCTFDQVDIDKLKIYDLEWLFLHIAIKSKGNGTTLNFQCENVVDGQQCGHINTIHFDLENIKIKHFEGHNTKIMLSEDIGIVMKHPNLTDAWKLQKGLESSDIDVVYNSMLAYVDTVFQGEQIFNEFTPDEFKVFIESLSQEQFSLLEQFFDTIPRLSHDIKVRCQKCKHEEIVPVEGLQSFLA